VSTHRATIGEKIMNPVIDASTERCAIRIKYPIMVLRRVLRCVGLAALFASGWAVTGLAQETTLGAGVRDIRDIVASGTLRVAMSRFDIPPFHWIHRDGTAYGIDVDFSHKLAAALNVKAVIISDFPTFDATVAAVTDGRADIAVNKLSQTYDRLTRVRFSDPLVTWRHAMLYSRAVVARDAKGGPAQDVLRKFPHKIGVITASAYVDFARQNFPLAQIVGISSWDDVVAALRDGKVDAIYRDEFEIKRVLKVSPALNVQFGAAIITDQLAFVSIAICDTCAKLQEFINYFIAQNKGTFTLDGILVASLREQPK
jgi:polar amino acid transport system substrate-binding protein